MGAKNTRRRFLQGQAASDRRTGQPPAADRSALLVSVRRRAMACEFEVQLAAGRDDDSMDHVFAALDLVEALEAQMTIYRADSEVAEINRSAASGPVSVEPRLFELFRLAEELHRDTGGAFDITSGPLSEAWGFSRREGRVPGEAAIAAALQRVGMRHVELDPARRTIALRRPGVSVNFNSLGKGYALDRIAELLAERGVDDYLLHGGRSSVLARGNAPGTVVATGGPPVSQSQPQAGSLCHGGWTIGLRHPLRPAERLAEFCLRDEALSTSGSGTQFFTRRGRRYGHILDPRSGRPAESLYSATVIAPTAAEADALSTAFYVMGPREVADYCAQHSRIAALLVAPAEREGDVRIFDFGLNDDRCYSLERREAANR